MKLSKKWMIVGVVIGVVILAIMFAWSLRYFFLKKMIKETASKAVTSKIFSQKELAAPKTAEKKSVSKMLVKNFNQIVAALADEEKVNKDDFSKLENKVKVDFESVAKKQEDFGKVLKQLADEGKVSKQEFTKLESQLNKNLASVFKEQKSFSDAVQKLADEGKVSKDQFAKLEQQIKTNLGALAEKQLDFDKLVKSFATEEKASKEKFFKLETGLKALSQKQEDFNKLVAAFQEKVSREELDILEEKVTGNLRTVAKNQSNLNEALTKKVEKTEFAKLETAVKENLSSVEEKVNKNLGAIAAKQLEFGKIVGDLAEAGKTNRDEFIKFETKVRQDLESLAQRKLKALDQQITSTLARIELAVNQEQRKILQKAGQQLAELSFASREKIERERTEAAASRAAQMEIFEARLLAAERKMKERVAELQNNTKRSIEKNLHAQIEKEKGEVLKVQEQFYKKQLNLFDQRLSATAQRLETQMKEKLQASSQESLLLFDKNLAAAREDLQKKFDGKLQLLFAADQQKRLKADAALTRKYAELLDSKLNLTENKIKKQVERGLFEFAKQQDEEGRKRQKNIMEKYMQFFDAKVTNVQHGLKKELNKIESKVMLSSAEKLRGEFGALRDDCLKSFNKELDLAKNEIKKTTEKELKIIGLEDAKKRNASFLEHQRLAEGRLSDIAAKMTENVEEKIATLISTEEKKREAEQARMFERSIYDFNAKLVAMKDKLKNKAKDQLNNLLKQGSQELLKSRKKLEAEYMTLLGKKFLTAQKDLKGEVAQDLQKIDQDLKTLLSQSDKERKLAIEEQRKEVRSLALQYSDLLNEKLAKLETEVKESTQNNLKLAMNKESAQNKKRAEVWASFVKDQLKKLSADLSKERDIAKETFEKFVQAEQRKRLIASNRRKKELAVVTSNMLKIIEGQYANQDPEENRDEFKTLVDRLQDIGRTNSENVLELDRKLEVLQKRNMGKKKISQAEIDAIVKREVDKQIKSLNVKKDPRIKRLKKVVALEKVRSLLKGAAGQQVAVGY